MPIKDYGVLKGRALEGKLAGQGGKKPHFQIHILAEEVHHRIAVNVVSDQEPSELLVLLQDNYRHPILTQVAAVPEGFTRLASPADGPQLDFIRGNLFDSQQMTLLPFDAPGTGNDLNEIFTLHLQRAIERQADIYAFGSKWGPETKADDYFHFTPGNGIHDIHLNQGSPSPHAGDNGIFQDGALFMHFPAEDRWLAFFLAFQSQFAQTDSRGNAIAGSPLFGPPRQRRDPDPVAATGVAIIAALVNPATDDVGHESVTLLNTQPAAVDLTGWQLASSAGRPLTLAGPVIAAGETARIQLTGQDVQLSNKGGTITLLDKAGQKVHGVAYTKEQANASGWTIVF
jgi:uncharacterized protein YukJ